MPPQAKSFATLIIEWHQVYGRKKLPWQTKHPYDVWLSEIMLQQTQVATVIERFHSFKKRFPTIEALSASSVDDVLSEWSGLGYYRRARLLHDAALQLQNFINQHHTWPTEASDWEALPGVGKSTANAIVSACFNKKEAILDANAKRVLERYYGPQKSPHEYWSLAYKQLDDAEERYAEYTQAIMDVGALLCKAKKKDCDACPLNTKCKQAYEKIEIFKKKATKPIVPLHVVVYKDNDRVAIEKNTTQSFWKDMWMLPLSAAPDITGEPTLKHELSHRTLLFYVKHAEVPNNMDTRQYQWVSISDLKARIFAVPSPIAELITAALTK